MRIHDVLRQLLHWLLSTAPGHGTVFVIPVVLVPAPDAFLSRPWLAGLATLRLRAATVVFNKGLCSPLLMEVLRIAFPH